MCDIHTRKEKRKEVCPPHHHLKIVEMSGFRGNEAEFRFVEYLIENAVSLEKIIIEPALRCLEPSLERIIIKLDSECQHPVKEAVRISAAKRLHSSLRPGLSLEILDCVCYYDLG